MEKSQLAMGMRPMVYSIPMSEKYESSSFSFRESLMLCILIEAASFKKEDFKYNINQHENEAILFYKILLFSQTDIDDEGIHIKDFDCNVS